MSRSLRMDRRAFLRGIGGVGLALPVLDCMGAEVTDQIPRRFCAMYTANGMSLPKEEHGLDEWSWFPTAERGAASAIFNSAQYFAAVVFTPLMAWVSHRFGWHQVYIMKGVAGLLLARRMNVTALRWTGGAISVAGLLMFCGLL